MGFAPQPVPLFWKALAAFLVMPGVVAYVGPLAFRPRASPTHPIGLILVGVGSVLLLWCVRDFYVAGRGTLAPWSPPQRLVTIGLYRFTRNPMYVAVLTVLAGWARYFAAPALWLYALIVAIAFHFRILLGEEPWLSRAHGDAWTAYRTRVPRWLF